MRMIHVIGLAIGCLASTVAPRGTAATIRGSREGDRVQVRGDHFEVTIDAGAGGQVTSARLFDGSQWNEILDPAAPFPQVSIAGPEGEYRLARGTARISNITSDSEAVRFQVEATPADASGRAAPWRVSVGYEVYAEGAVFIDLSYRLDGGAVDVTTASLGLTLNRGTTGAARFRDDRRLEEHGGFQTARFAFGHNSAKSFSNEVEAIVEEMKPMAGTTVFEKTRGRWNWTLASAAGAAGRIDAPFHYTNRVAFGLGAPATGKPRSNVIGQRVYHWVNFLDTNNWYPSDEQIDTMARLGATMLILHHEWMLQRGSNGNPHANYNVVRDQDEMVRTIARAHERGMRVGLYMRGVEEYGLNDHFFEKYCRRDWDGIYVDWHGIGLRTIHDIRYEPWQHIGETHASEDGSRLPARDYFIFMKRLRETVGPDGFLIGHQGSSATGFFSNLGFDAYLPGEYRGDHSLFADRESAIYSGMTAGGATHPWTLDSEAYRNPAAVARMAAWGFYPHVILGIQRAGRGPLMTLEPTDPVHRFVLPYWNLLRQIDVERADVINHPCVNRTMINSSAPEIEAIGYKGGDGELLVIVANLGTEETSASLELDKAAIGMQGDYELFRIEAETGARMALGEIEGGRIGTSMLEPNGIEGYLLEQSRR